MEGGRGEGGERDGHWLTLGDLKTALGILFSILRLNATSSPPLVPVQDRITDEKSSKNGTKARSTIDVVCL